MDLPTHGYKQGFQDTSLWNKPCYFPYFLQLQAILGGPVAADELYNASFFDQFRKENIVKTAVKFAKVVIS